MESINEIHYNNTKTMYAKQYNALKEIQYSSNPLTKKELLVLSTKRPQYSWLFKYIEINHHNHPDNTIITFK